MVGLSDTDSPPQRRVALFGCEIDALTMDETVELVDHLVQVGVPSQHVALNALGIVMMHDDARLRSIVQGSRLVNADGQSLVWAARALGHRIPERVAGPDLFNRLVSLAERRGYRVYLLGATQDVLDAACSAMMRQHPELLITGRHHGYFDEAESTRLVDDIRQSGAHMLFLAMPSPSKEYWLSENLTRLGVPFCMGIGGTLDIVSGAIRRAPIQMQRSGLEWVYRLYQEPKRMWRRYLVGNTRFLMLAFREWLRVNMARM